MRRRPRSSRALNAAAGRQVARELAMSQRWAIISRYSCRTRGGAVTPCINGERRKVAYPSQDAAMAAHRDLYAAGAHRRRDALAYRCPIVLPESGEHWHLTSHLDGGAAR